MTSIKLIVIYMALVRVGYAQNRYPELSINNEGDTVVTLTLEQTKALNMQLIGMDECLQASDSTEQELHNAKILIGEYKKVVDQYVGITQKQDSVIKVDNLLFASHKKVIADYVKLDNQHLSYEKGLKKKIIGWKVGFSISVGASLIYLAFSR